MIKKETFAKAMNTVREFERQMHRMMDLGSKPGANLLLISTQSYYLEALRCLFAEAFGMSDRPLLWWLYECFEDEDRYILVDGNVVDVVDPGDFYDALIQYPDQWEDWYQRKDAPHQPTVMSIIGFRKMLAHIRQEQKDTAEVLQTAMECGSTFCVFGQPGPYLEAVLLLLEDMFNDKNGMLRWYITKSVDHKVWLQNKMHDLNDPESFYSFMLTEDSASARRKE